MMNWIIVYFVCFSTRKSVAGSLIKYYSYNNKRKKKKVKVH